MLDCNITEALYTYILKEEYGICSNTDTIISMALAELRYNLSCTGVIMCYTPETCVGSTTLSCTLSASQTLIQTTCDLTATQSFDDP